MKNIVLMLGLFCLVKTSFAQRVIDLTNFTIELNEVVKTKFNTFKERDNLSNSAEVFFNTYFFPDNLAQYSSLYLNGEFYGLSQSEFEQWQHTIRSAKITAEHIIYFTSGGVSYAGFPYQSEYGYYLHRHVKLAKQINGQWYALPKNEDINMADVKKLITVINSSYLMKMVSDVNVGFDDESRNASVQSSLRELLDVRQNQYLNVDYVSSARKQLPFQSTFEWTDSGLRKFQNQVKPEIEKWLSGMNLTPSQQSQIIHLLYRGEQIEAVVKVDEYDNDEGVTVNDYIKKLKGIYSTF